MVRRYKLGGLTKGVWHDTIAVIEIRSILAHALNETT